MSDTPEKKFSTCFEQLYKICEENSWGDPFSYARSREIHMANTLNHTISSTLSGADAIDEDGECEYKTTTCPKISATYNGISVQETWEKQEEYLKKYKIGKYKNHYFDPISEPSLCIFITYSDYLSASLTRSSIVFTFY